MNEQTNTTTTTDLSKTLKSVAAKGYASVVNVTAHTTTFADRMLRATPDLWTNASSKADSEMDAIFAELGL